VYTSDLIWDVAALIVSIFALVYIRKLYVKFRGGAYGKSYRYYCWAMIVFVLTFLLRIALDFFEISPNIYGMSVRNPAIMIATVPLLLGFRSSAKFWSLPKSPRTADTEGEPGTSVRPG